VSLLALGAAVGGGIGVASVIPHAVRAVRAARSRAARRSSCPFEDDDDVPRPLWREARDVVVEALTLLRLALLPVPAHWYATSTRTTQGPIVLLVPERHLPAVSLRLLARRLARDLDAAIHPVPARVGAADLAAVERLADIVATLASEHPHRSLLLVGHGLGGRTALAAARRQRRRVVVVTLATDHRGGTQPSAGEREVEVLSLYSLHDAHLDPPAAGYLTGAMNVAVRDVGHYEMVTSPRVYEVARELLADGAATQAGEVAS
jgi:hypothetical protein